MAHGVPGELVEAPEGWQQGGGHGQVCQAQSLAHKEGSGGQHNVQGRQPGTGE